MPVNQCLEPPKERLFQGIDEIFLEILKKNMKADPYGPGIPSVALLCADVRSTEDFEVLNVLHQTYVCGYVHHIILNII